MTLLQILTQPKQATDFTLAFTIIGGIWAIVTFIIGYIDNNLKRKLEYFKTVRDYNEDLREWANSVVDLMTTAGHLCLIDPQRDLDFYSKRHTLLIELSSWTDKGRFFLPNSGFDTHGHHKPTAYRGFRSAALDHILECYQLVCSMDYADQKKNLIFKKQIMDTKRKFVSAIQDELDPRKFEVEIGGFKRAI